MPDFQVLVTITTDTIEHAQMVADERVNFDEELFDVDGIAFDYRISAGPVSASPASDDDVLEALPRNGDPIPFGDLGKKLNATDLSSLRASLLRLETIGIASLTYGRGWRRVL